MTSVNNNTIHREIVRRTEELRCLLEQLIAIPSPPGSESEALEFVRDLLRFLGLATSWVHLERTGLEKHPAFVPSGARQGRNLLAVWGAPKAKPGRYPVLFNGHIDVVPPGADSCWTSPPYQATEREGRIYGNGAADMKGGIACLLYVLWMLIEGGFKPRKPVAVEIVVDEERLGNGTLANILAGVSAEQAIFLEPSGCDRIVSGHRGAIIFRISLRGQGSELCSRGTSPTIASHLVDVFDALERWKSKRRQMCAERLSKDRADRAPLYFGRIEGGHWFSSPLGDIQIDGVLGYVPGECFEDVKSAFCEHLGSMPKLGPLMQDGKLAISLDRGFVEPSVTPPDGALVTSLQSAAATVLGEEPTAECCENSGCDIRLRRLYDSDCECVWYGPGGSRCHQSDECVSAEEMVKVSQVLAEWIIRECGG